MKKVFALCLLCLFCFTACGSGDFSFTVAWNMSSSYDSTSGRLVKSTDTREPEKFVTELHFSAAELAEIRSLLLQLDPAVYDGFSPDISDELKQQGLRYAFGSKPPENWVLTYRDGDTAFAVSCPALWSVPTENLNEDTRRLQEIMLALTERITDTDAWQNLPEYEVLYQ